jgi:hypothetical protein
VRENCAAPLALDGLFHFSHRYRGGLMNSAAPRLAFGELWSTPSTYENKLDAKEFQLYQRRKRVLTQTLKACPDRNSRELFSSL